MIKEIALRKLASDNEGINPYGVGALGTGAIGAGLGGAGKLIENKITSDSEALTKDLLVPYEKGYKDYRKAKALRKELIKEYAVRRPFLRRGLGGGTDFVFNDKYKGIDLDDILGRVKAVEPTIFAKESLSRKNALNLLKQYRDTLKNNRDDFAKYIQTRDIMRKSTADVAKKFAKPFKRAGLISAAVGAGLGGKYLYDKLTD